jgi:MATE family multidrug resistance protein
MGLSSGREKGSLPAVMRSQLIWKSSLVPLVALASPMLLGQAGQVLLQMVDTIMIGQVGAVPLAGAALAGNLVMFALYFAYGSLGAVAPKVAQAEGAGRRRQVGLLLRAGLTLGALVGALMAFFLGALVPVLGFLGQPPEVVEVTRPFLLLIAISMVPAMVSLVVGQMAEALGRPWPVFWFLLFAVGVNVFLNWVFIFGNLGFPALGLTGAGVATLVARLVQMGAILWWMRVSDRLAVVREAVRRLTWRRKTRELFRRGLPVAGQDVLEGGSFALGTLMLGWIGTVALAANQVTISIASLAWMFPVALSMATSMMVARAVGAGNYADARRHGVVGLVLGVALMAGCAVVYITSGHWLAGFFTEDPEVLALTGVLVTIAGIYQISDAVQSISLGALRGMLDNRVPMWTNAICYWGLSLPTVYLLAFPLGLGAVGVWIGYLPWMFLTGVFFMFRFWRKTTPVPPG